MESFAKLKVLAIAFVCCLGAVGLLACGAATSSGRVRAAPERAGAGACSLEDERGRALRVEPRTSQMSCQEIEQMTLLLPRAPGRWPIYGGRKVVEVCQIFKPPSAMQVKCHESADATKQFAIVYVKGSRAD
jgi:hypothetical protein